MTSGNVMPNNTPKKRKLELDEPAVNLSVPPRSSGAKAFGSSQPQQKSQFEKDLEKLTQDISGLKEKNSEKDQQWERPPLEDFNETRDDICFQQIDAEEGTLQGGKTTVRLFGVTEVGAVGYSRPMSLLLTLLQERAFGPASCHWISALSIYRRSCEFHQRGLRTLPGISGEQAGPVPTNDPICPDSDERKPVRVSGEPKELLSQDHRDGAETYQQITECSGEKHPKHQLQEHVEVLL